jgi:L-gulonate 3-dehydrogenase
VPQLLVVSSLVVSGVFSCANEQIALTKGKHEIAHEGRLRRALSVWDGNPQYLRRVRMKAQKVTEQNSRASTSKVAVIGTGVIGRSWIQAFAAAGCETWAFDVDQKRAEDALAWVASDLELDCSEGIIGFAEAEERRARVKLCSTLNEALDGASYVQENGPEDLKQKQALYAELDCIAAPDAILASSTSGLDMTEISRGLSGGSRCIVAHPVNPPHVIPVVEVLPGKQTDPRVVSSTCEFLRSVGRKPVLLNFYLHGFLLNRMQAALIREAINLAESGVADIDSIDTAIRDGLGLRWALMGPFGVANSNADGGVREYFTRFRESYRGYWSELDRMPSMSKDLIEQLGEGTDQMMDGVPRSVTRRWRDRMVRKICALKNADPGR